MGLPEPKTDRHYAYADYLTWPDDERWEIIEGRAHALDRSHTLVHQKVLGMCMYLIGTALAGKPCQLLIGPVAVLLPRGDEDANDVDTVLEPDGLVVCDPSKLDERWVRGAPDLIVEVLSESTAHRDLDEKMRLYEKHGVLCYLIADPKSKTLIVRYLESGGKYGYPDISSGNSLMPIRIFDGLVLDLARVFEGIERWL